MFFLQMAGFPGSGKSTLAREIGKRTGAIVIDHDIVKSALLESIETEFDPKFAGQISYNIDWSLIDFHLSQGQSVIFDSPCFYTEILEKGSAMSVKHGATYKYVECILKDFIEANNRLANREKKISQIDHVLSEKDYNVWILGSKKPIDIEIVTVDSSQPLDTYIDKVLAYVTDSIRSSKTSNL